MDKIDYPKWLFHETEPSRLVTSAEEQEILGADWKESPVPPKPTSSVDESKLDQARAKAAAERAAAADSKKKAK